MARDSERLRQELASRYDFTVDGLFKEVDDWNYKYIDANNLRRFLIKTGYHSINDAQILAILRRFDLDADAKLTLKEFGEGIKPIFDYFVVKKAKPEYEVNGNKSKISSPHKRTCSRTRYCKVN